MGLACAAACARAGRSVVVLESDSAIGRGITSRSSEVVHAGLYAPPDAQKTTLCIAGRRRLYAYCEAERVPHRRLGKLVVATQASEVGALEALHARALANGVEGLALLERADVRALEPEVEAVAAIHSRETGIVDAHALCLALAAESEAAGAVVVCGRRVEALARRSFGWSLDVRSRVGGETGGARGAAAGEGASESIDAGVVIDAAGLAADEIASIAGLDVDALGWRIHPCKGDYFGLAPGSRPPALARLVYPVSGPQAAGLGIHVTLDLAGRIRFGPDAEYVDSLDLRVDPAKAPRFREAVARYLPRLASAELVPDYSGIRPKLSGPGEPWRDFVIEEASAHGAPGFIACLGIESPGLTAALAIGERVAALVSGALARA